MKEQVLKTLETFPQGLMGHDLKADMKQMHSDYCKKLTEAEKIICKRRKITRKIFYECIEYGEADYKNCERLLDEWEDAVNKIQAEVTDNKQYKYWSLDIEHEEEMIQTVYWSGYFWIRFDGRDYSFEFIYDIEQAIELAYKIGRRSK